MYQFVCPKCEGRSYSASKLSNLSNHECPYCGSPLGLEKELKPAVNKATKILPFYTSSDGDDRNLKSE